MNRRSFFERAGTIGALALGACGGSDGVHLQDTSSALPPAAPGQTAPTPPVPAPAPPVQPATSGSFVTWDGGSGPSSGSWSKKLGVGWKNPGTGDWLDADQRPQGGAPIGTGTVSRVGPLSVDVASLVRRWLAGADNRGFYLKSRQDWAFTFVGRTNANLAARPQLRIVTDKGDFEAPCIGNAHWALGRSSASDSRAAFRVAKDIWFAIVQFDLTGITGRVESASLTLYCQELRVAGVLEVYEANPPGFRLGSGKAPPQLGLAHSYPKDREIESHPQVLFASDFSDLGKSRWQVGSVRGAEQIYDAGTGSTYLRALIPKDKNFGCDLERNVVNGTAAGTTDKVETELYARYYVYLEESWGSTIDVTKMPGWDGRFGWWNPAAGYWHSTDGGSGRPSGKKFWDAGRWVYEGAAMRGHVGTKAGDGNPYDELFWLGGYIYHLDQEGPFGEGVKWNGVVIGKGHWFSIEHYIKMNSIVGPYDAVGNGDAVRDGEYRVWVDGVLAFERTNFRWRRHPEMGIQGFLLNWWHGGREPAPSDMHFRMNSVVIARDYIGPRNDG